MQGSSSSIHCDICAKSDENLLKKELIDCVKTFFSNGLVSVGGGNHSFRQIIRNRIWITPSGYPRSHLITEDLVSIDLDGNVKNGNLKPSIEIPFHTEIYRVRPDINAICHTHNPYTQGFFLSAKLGFIEKDIYTISELLPIEYPEPLGKIPIVVEYRQLGSRALGRLIGKACMKDVLYPRGVIVMLNHGVIGMGRCIHEAKFLIELSEEWARCLFIFLNLDNNQKSFK